MIDDRFARKAIEKGADGLIAVAAGAGGHAGRWSPFALIQEIRSWFDGPLALSGSIANGGAILAAQAMGADVAYIGSPFIATDEARADAGYKQGIVDSSAKDIVYSSLFTGVHGNYLRASIEKAGLDPDNLPESCARSDELRRWQPGPRRGRTSGARARALARSTGSSRRPSLIARWSEEYRAAQVADLRLGASDAFQHLPPGVRPRHRTPFGAVHRDVNEAARGGRFLRPFGEDAQTDSGRWSGPSSTTRNPTSTSPGKAKRREIVAGGADHQADRVAGDDVEQPFADQQRVHGAVEPLVIDRCC